VRILGEVSVGGWAMAAKCEYVVALRAVQTLDFMTEQWRSGSGSKPAPMAPIYHHLAQIPAAGDLS
jgi:hypothetical protein